MKTFLKVRLESEVCQTSKRSSIAVCAGPRGYCCSYPQICERKISSPKVVLYSFTHCFNIFPLDYIVISF